jgi:dihydrofolate reductase
MGHVLVMGRLTFESIGRPLPGRRTIVVTRNRFWRHPDVEVAHSFEEALALAGPADEVFVCGGAQIYAEAMPWAHRLLITEVFLEPDGDVLFPLIPADDWEEVGRVERERLAWVTYEPR